MGRVCDRAKFPITHWDGVKKTTGQYRTKNPARQLVAKWLRQHIEVTRILFSPVTGPFSGEPQLQYSNTWPQRVMFAHSKKQLKLREFTNHYTEDERKKC